MSPWPFGSGSEEPASFAEDAVSFALVLDVDPFVWNVDSVASMVSILGTVNSGG